MKVQILLNIVSIKNNIINLILKDATLHKCRENHEILKKGRKKVPFICSIDE
jgi:hypothetical protein